MPNGVSCAIFAIKSYMTGQKEDNDFRNAIGVIQTLRTVNSAIESSSKFQALTQNSKWIGLFSFFRKMLYPLIIASGAFNTVVSDDRLKTGVSQGLGITSMYFSEKIAEKGLNLLATKIKVPENPIMKALLIGAKGLGFVCASQLGYAAGSKIGKLSVDSIRNIKNKEVSNFDENSENKNIFKEGFIDDYSDYDKTNVFDEIESQ